MSDWDSDGTFGFHGNTVRETRYCNSAEVKPNTMSTDTESDKKSSSFSTYFTFRGSLRKEKLSISCGTGNRLITLLICLIRVSWEAWKRGSSVQSTGWFPVEGASDSRLYWCRERWVPRCRHASRIDRLNSWNSVWNWLIIWITMVFLLTLR